MCKFFSSRGEFHDAILVALSSKKGSSPGDTTKQVPKKGLDLRRNDVPVKENEVTVKPLGSENTYVIEF